MRMSDWSSDVCSSDLQPRLQGVIPVFAFSARATRDDRPAFAGIGTTRAFFGEFAPCIMIDEQVQFAHALRDRYETKTFIAERGPARDLGQGLGSKRALDTLGKAEPSFDRIEQAHSTRCQTPARALRVVAGSDCRPQARKSAV